MTELGVVVHILPPLSCLLDRGTTDHIGYFTKNAIKLITS